MLMLRKMPEGGPQKRRYVATHENIVVFFGGFIGAIYADRLTANFGRNLPVRVLRMDAERIECDHR